MGTTKKMAPKTYVTVGMAEDELRKVRKALTIIIKKLEAEDRKKLLTSARYPMTFKACPLVNGDCLTPVWDRRTNKVSAEAIAGAVGYVVPCLLKLLRYLERQHRSIL